MRTREFLLSPLRRGVVAIAALLSLSAAAEASEIDWKGTAYMELKSEDKNTFEATSEKVFYLYNVGQKRFINVGASYDAEPIMSNVGIKMIFAPFDTSDDGRYVIRTSINNSYERFYLGLKGNTNNDTEPSRLLCDLKPQIDEKESGYQCGWRFSQVATGSNRLYISNCRSANNERMYYNSNTGRIETKEGATGENAEWLLITLNEYEAEIKVLREGEIEVTAYITDSRFSRNNLWVTAWNWDKTDGSLHQIGEPEDLVYDGTTYTGYGFPGGVGYGDANRGNVTVNYYSQFNVAEVKQGEANRLSQTIKNLPAGSYRLTCQGFYDDGNYGTATDASCYIFANDQRTTLKPITEAVLPYGVTVPTEAGTKITYTVGTETPLLSPYTYTHSSGFSQTYCTTATKDGKTVASDGVAAAMFFNYDEDISVNEVYVNIREGEDLVIGFNKGTENGWAATDNFRLYYLGRYEYVIDEDQLPSHVVNDDLFDANVNFRRTLGANWTSIVLPFDVTTSQFEKTFGASATISALVGIDPSYEYRILFNEVKKGAADEVYMHAGTHYIIGGAGSPRYAADTEYSFVINNNETLTTTVSGPLYQFSNINRRSDDPQPLLMNILMHESHHAFDRSKIHHQVITSKVVSPVVEFNKQYGRNEAKFIATWGGTASDGYYKIDYSKNVTFKDAIQRQHSMAVLLKVDNSGNSEKEADVVTSFAPAEGTQGGFGMVVKQGELQYHIKTDNGWQYIDSDVMPDADKYYFVVATWDNAGTAKIYVNGELKSTRTDVGTSLVLPSDAASQCIGIGGNVTATGIERAFNGSVVIARLYDVALTDKQVTALYEKLTPIKDKPELKHTVSAGKDRYLKFIGTYGYEEGVTAPKGSYFISNGTMYHLTADTKLYGFRGYIEETDAAGEPLRSTEPLTLRVKACNGTVTDITPVTADESRDSAPENVYNMSGQVVRHGTTSTAGLPKGIYIICGKKVVVR